MEGMQLDLTRVLALWLASAFLMVPLLALAMRFAVPPVLDAFGRLRSGVQDGRGGEDRLLALESRVSALTGRVEELSSAERRRSAPFA